MGMYPLYKEVRPSMLQRMLADPLNARMIDDMLFEVDSEKGVYDWSEEASRFEPAPGVLFDPLCPAISMTREEKLQLGELDLGKLPDSNTELFFRYFLRLADLPKCKASRLLDALDALGETDRSEEEEEAWLESVEVEPAKLSLRQPRVEQGGSSKAVGFATELVCYGISSYRTSEDLRGVWRCIDQVFERFPLHVEGFLEHQLSEIGRAIRYYHGCAMRESADLYMVS